MPPRRPTLPPPPEIKHFTADEIEQGIRKLRRRIEEVQALDPPRMSYNDQRVGNVEQAIDTTILEVFGPNSPEYRRHNHHRIWHEEGTPNTLTLRMGPPDTQECFAAGVPQTITLLEGLIRALEEKRVDLGYDATARVRTAFEGLDPHPRIAAVCTDLYRKAEYRHAVFDSYMALENLVKEKSGRYDLDGTKLMQQVFSPNSPVLAFNDLQDQTDQDEQQGMMFLFAGTVLALRNPRAHACRKIPPSRHWRPSPSLAFSPSGWSRRSGARGRDSEASEERGAASPLRRPPHREGQARRQGRLPDDDEGDRAVVYFGEPIPSGSC